MIDIALLQALYKKLTGKEYDQNADNLHEIAEMLRALQQKDCFEGVIINGSVNFIYTKIYKYSDGIDYSTMRLPRWKINYNKRIANFVQAAQENYVVIYLKDGFNYINFKDAFISSITTTLSSCQDISPSCPVVNTNVHLEISQANGYTQPKDIVYIDSLIKTAAYVNIDYNTNTLTINSNDPVTVTIGDKIFVTYDNTGSRYNVNLLGTVSNINTNEITIQFDQSLQELITLTSNTPTFSGVTFNYGKVVNKTDNPKAVAILTSESENVLQRLYLKILPNDTSLIDDITNLEKYSWTINIFNYGIKYQFDATSTENLHEFELIDILPDETAGIEKYKLRQDQIAPIYSGSSRYLSNISDYGTSSNDVVVDKKLYMGPFGHQFDNWGAFENNRQVTSGFSSTVLSAVNTNNYIYKLIADENLATLLSVIRVVPTDLTKYKIKPRLFVDLTDIDITNDVWQSTKAYIYEFKPKTKTVFIHSKIADETLDINDGALYEQSGPYELLLIDSNGTNLEATLPSWAESITKTIKVDTSGNYPIIYTTWKIVVKDSELLIDNTNLEKTYELYVTNKSSLDEYATTGKINIKGKINIRLVPGIMFKFDNILSEYTSKFNSAQSVTINGKTIKYSGFASDATPGREDLSWDSPYIRTMLSGTSTTTNDTFVDILPHKNIRDKFYVASPYSINKYTVQVMIKGVDTSNPDIITAIKNRIRISITDHNGTRSEDASVVYDPMPYVWHNPQTGEDENVLIVQAEWTGSQMHNIASNFSAGTKITATLYDSDIRFELVRSESNIYIPAVIDLSQTGSSTTVDCDNIEYMYSKIMMYKSEDTNTVESWAQTNIHDLAAMSFNISLGDSGALPSLDIQGIKLNQENVTTVTAKFKGTYLNRLHPVANGLCGVNRPFIPWKYGFYNTRTYDSIIVPVINISDYSTITGIRVTSIQPNLIDFVIIPGEVDNLYVKKEVETISGLKHIYYVIGDTISRDYVNPNDDNIIVDPIEPTVQCPDGKHCYDVVFPCCDLPLDHHYKYCTSMNYNVGDSVVIAYEGTFWSGVVVEVPNSPYDCGRINIKECRKCFSG